MSRRLVTFRNVDPVADVFADLEVREVPKGKYTTEQLIEHSEGAEALFVHSENPYDRDLFEAVPSLRVVGKAGSGIDNIDVEAATDHGVAVVHTPGMNADSVGEYTVGLLVAYWRRIPAAERHLREGGWRSEAWWGTEIRDKTVGIVGLGAAGTATAERLVPFGADLVAYDPYVDQAHADAVGADLVGLDELLDRSDVVSLHVRLNEETRGLIDADAFDRMGEDAVLVNTSRGEVVDREALLDALDAGDVGGAALDVFHEEPPSPDDPLFDHENVLATPHLAGAGRETRIRMLRMTAENVVKVLAGDPVEERFVANPEVL
ncbi:MAG: NAD(P)-dependent oxidoreductase [Haloferacaceae archaeon]